MANVRARRRRRSADYYDPPKPRGVPRLAAIKLDAHKAGFEKPRVTKSGLAKIAWLSGGVLGLAVLGASLLGGGLFDVREAAVSAADDAAAGMGFRLADVQIHGVEGARADEVRALIAPDGRSSMLSLDPQAVKTRIESLDWVASVSVQRLWPQTLRVDIRRRAAIARWQDDGQVSVIDVAGERMLGERASDNQDLPLIVGEGAGPEAAPLLAALEQLPDVRERMTALVRVGARRWNMQLESGATVALPAVQPERALMTLERLQDRYALLDRPVDRIDLRLPGRVAVRVLPALAGGRNHEFGAV